MTIVCLDMEGVLVPEIWITFAEKVEPLVAKELNHLNALYVKLNDEVHKNRLFKKLLGHSR